MHEDSRVASIALSFAVARVIARDNAKTGVEQRLHKVQHYGRTRLVAVAEENSGSIRSLDPHVGEDCFAVDLNCQCRCGIE